MSDSASEFISEIWNNINDNMTLTAIKQLAKHLGIAKYSTMKKRDIIGLITKTFEGYPVTKLEGIKNICTQSRDIGQDIIRFLTPETPSPTVSPELIPTASSDMADLSANFAGLQINPTDNPDINPNTTNPNTTNITSTNTSLVSPIESSQITTNIINRGTGAGGANTNATGLFYEAKTDLSTDYIIVPSPTNSPSTTSTSPDSPLGKYPRIKFTGNNKKFIKANKSELHKIMTAANEINTNLEPAAGCKNPDEAYIAPESNRVYIIEKKFQQTSGSVDEKIQTGVFKKYHYGKLFPNYRISYIYCLSDWFRKAEYKSVLDYLSENQIPVFWGNDPDYKQKIIRFMCSEE